MKFKVFIEESTQPQSKVVTVTFRQDKRRKKFEIFCDFYPFAVGIRKWEIWQLNIKFDSEEIVLDDGTKTYQTIFTCDKAIPIEKNGDGKDHLKYR